ncbi:MAG: hypothetical protein Q9157_008332 [Trypethelium eluteriae]
MGDNGILRPIMQEANNSNNMWAKADKKLCEDPKKCEKLEKLKLRARDCFQSLLECVLKLESLINTAAKPCFPAALASRE